MYPSGQELLDHVYSLAEELDVAVFEARCPDCEFMPAGMMLVTDVKSIGPNLVELSSKCLTLIGVTEPPTTPLAYLIALHELGHAATARTRTGCEKIMSTQKSEYLAWDWALEHSLFEPSQEHLAAIAARIRTYTDDRRLKPYEPLLELAAKLERVTPST